VSKCVSRWAFGKVDHTNFSILESWYKYFRGLSRQYSEVQAIVGRHGWGGRIKGVSAGSERGKRPTWRESPPKAAPQTEISGFIRDPRKKLKTQLVNNHSAVQPFRIGQVVKVQLPSFKRRVANVDDIASTHFSDEDIYSSTATYQGVIEAFLNGQVGMRLDNGSFHFVNRYQVTFASKDKHANEGKGGNAAYKQETK
jgi:hypothetical protein